MKIEFDSKTGLPRFRLEEKDLKDANEIDVMMKTPGWKILQDYMTVARESIIEAGKDGIRQRSRSELSNYKWAILKGWDECMTLPSRIVKRAEDDRADTNKEDNSDAGYGYEE